MGPKMLCHKLVILVLILSGCLLISVANAQNWDTFRTKHVAGARAAPTRGRDCLNLLPGGLQTRPRNSLVFASAGTVRGDFDSTRLGVNQWSRSSRGICNISYDSRSRVHTYHWCTNQWYQVRFDYDRAHGGNFPVHFHGTNGGTCTRMAH
ncbi:unnamed protein product [Allacma fusca]|uniref:Uncharacterized protein n=1 Tax=Allacma fusca TaxID=39272 RepID=A0A8J2KB48_9HEXA|nr:unnamed protein product [Allacma fusca]